MKRSKNGSSPKQYAYAMNKLGGNGRSKKDIALSSGYSLTMAKNAKSKIENTEGFQNAVLALAHDSNNVAMSILAEYKARGLKNFSNKDLNGALNAIGAAWEKFNKQRAPNGSNQPLNPIKQAIFQKIENQTVNVTEAPASASRPETIEVEAEPVAAGVEEDPGF